MFPFTPEIAAVVFVRETSFWVTLNFFLISFSCILVCRNSHGVVDVRLLHALAKRRYVGLVVSATTCGCLQIGRTENSNEGVNPDGIECCMKTEDTE